MTLVRKGYENNQQLALESVLIVFLLIIVARDCSLPVSQREAYAGAMMTTRIYR